MREGGWPPPPPATALTVGWGGGLSRENFRIPMGGGENEAREHGVMPTVFLMMCNVTENYPWLCKFSSLVKRDCIFPRLHVTKTPNA